MRRLRMLAFAGYAWLVFALLAIPAALAVALLPDIDTRWRAVRGLLRTLFRTTGIGVTTRMQASPPPPPCCFVANHASYVDGLLLVGVLPRPVAFVAKQELARVPVLGWLLARMGAVFVDRFDPQRATAVVAEARGGHRDFLFFPEGTFRRMPGLLPFHLGAFAAAAEAGTSVVPIALRGTRAVLRGSEWLPRRAPLMVLIGAAIEPRRGTDHWTEALRLAAAARAFLLAETGEPDLDQAMPPPAPHLDPDQHRHSAPGA